MAFFAPSYTGMPFPYTQFREIVTWAGKQISSPLNVRYPTNSKMDHAAVLFANRFTTPDSQRTIIPICSGRAFRKDSHKYAQLPH